MKMVRLYHFSFRIGISLKRRLRSGRYYRFMSEGVSMKCRLRESRRGEKQPQRELPDELMRSGMLQRKNNNPNF